VWRAGAVRGKRIVELDAPEAFNEEEKIYE
jgi:hypothetical protein